MSLLTATRIAELVGEMEAPACESLDHPDYPQWHDEGPATHYGRVHCIHCGLNVIKSYCTKFVLAMQTVGESECVCGVVQRTADLVTILGPVNK